MGKMKNLFDEVAGLVEYDAKVTGATVEKHMSNLIEEMGEFAQEVNKNLGIKGKKKTDTPAVITENIAQEAADAIQIIIGVCYLNGVTYDQLIDQLKKKNGIYEEFI